jgi:hypothetical protein
MQGIVRDATEEGVVALIESAGRWANSRGHFEDQERQRAGGSYFRANSLIGETRNALQFDGPIKVLPFRGEFFALRDDVLSGFNDDVPGDTAVDAPLRTDTVARRLASLLPRRVVTAIRAAIKAERTSQLYMHAREPRSDLELARMVASGLVRRSALRLGVLRGNAEMRVLHAVSDGEDPELMWTIANYNVVKFDGMYYGLRHGVHIDWTLDIARLPGVIAAKRASDVTAEIERITGTAGTGRTGAAAGAAASGPAGERSSRPRRLATLHDYNVIEYEGWVYGIPTSLGEIDLTEVDVMGKPGVIRDVSRDVVEDEIAELKKLAQAA